MSSKLQPLGNHFINGYLHPLFGASNDSEMFTQMVWISFFYILSVAASMAMFPAPYGNKMLFMLFFFFFYKYSN